MPTIKLESILITGISANPEKTGNDVRIMLKSLKIRREKNRIILGSIMRGSDPNDKKLEKQCVDSRPFHP